MFRHFFKSLCIKLVMVIRMKKVIPYVISLILGTIFGYLVFEKTDFNIKEVFGEYEEVTGFQLGVFNDIEVAKEFKNKYTPSVILKDDDVYRVYYSILKDDDVIAKMEDYLSLKEISFYKKKIIVHDADLISSREMNSGMKPIPSPASTNRSTTSALPVSRNTSGDSSCSSRKRSSSLR